MGFFLSPCFMFLLPKQPLPRKVMVHSKPLGCTSQAVLPPQTLSTGTCGSYHCLLLQSQELHHSSSPGARRAAEFTCNSVRLLPLPAAWGTSSLGQGWGRPHNSDSGRVAPTENWKHHRVGGCGYQHTPSPTCMSRKQHHVPNIMKKTEPTSFRQKSRVLSS